MKLGVFARDAGIYAAGNIGLRAASLLLTPIYAYWLSLSEFGLWATLQVTIQVMLILMTLGMREAAVRFVSETDDRRRIRQVLGTSLALVVTGGIWVTVFAALFLAPFFRTILHVPQPSALVFLAGCAALAQGLSVNVLSYYRAKGKPLRYMGWGLGGAALLFASTVAALCWLRLGLHGVLYAYILSYLVVFVFVSFDIFSTTGFGVSLRVAPGLLRFGLPLVVASAGQFAITGLSVYLLSYFAGLEVVAVYSLGYKLALLLSIAISLPFQLAFQPYVYGNLNEPQLKVQAGRLFTYLIAATMTTAFFLLVAARLLLPVIAPPAYAEAILVVILLLPGQAFLGVHFFGETLISAMKRTYLLALLNAGCAALCLGLNFALIPRMGWQGAAVASSGAAIFIDSIEIAIGLRMFGLGRHMEWRRLAAVGAVFAGLLFVAGVLHHASPAVFAGGLVCYFVFSTLFLYAGPCCTVEERRLVKDTLGRVGSFVAARASLL